MNNQEYDIMNEVYKGSLTNQRELARHSGYSIGKVNSSLKILQQNGYLNTDLSLTRKALLELEDKRPENAIILAAGYGMRMVPINVEIPKGLLEVSGEALIERMIRQLHEAGITKIDVVVGFMKEQYEYLIDEYDVNLVCNKEYSTKNNLHSLKCVIEKVGNTYIMPCDIWCKENPFSKNEWYSWYMVTDKRSEDSTVRINRKKELVNVKKGEIGNEMIGVAYITRKDSELLKKNIKKYSAEKEHNHCYWETALLDGGKWITAPKEIKNASVSEINTYEELRELDEGSSQLKSDVMQLIAEVLNCEEEEIGNIRPLKKGMTNRSFEFRCREKRYIMRIPGEGTDKMISRKNEHDVYQQLKGTGISDQVIYISPDNGYKITEYIENGRNCDSENKEDVKMCMLQLKEFHSRNLQVNHTFDLFEEIEYYEKLRGNERSVYKDYAGTKEKIYELKEYIDKQPKQIALAHIDAVSDNFLITDEKIYLIDWEYAGMQDIHVDIAMFAIYALYDRTQVEQLISYYFQGDVEKDIKIKIYCYIAVCGLLWSNWCEYKRQLGVEFGEYSLRQYRYAKDYYRIVQEERKKLDMEEEHGTRS